MALSPYPRRSSASNRSIHLRKRRSAHAKAPRLYPSARRDRCELVHRTTGGTDELLAGSARERALAQTAHARPRLVSAEIQRLAAKLRDHPSSLDRKVRAGLIDGRAGEEGSAISSSRPSANVPCCRAGEYCHQWHTCRVRNGKPGWQRSSDS